MSLWALFLHLTNFMAPAFTVALILSGIICWHSGCRWGRWWRAVGMLVSVGVAALATGLVLSGRDGSLAAYAAMVLLMGLLAAWLARPRAGSR